ncbi:hypothetical protein [Rhodococcus koreensis]
MSTHVTASPRPARRPGSISTAEIKARIEAMFADDHPQPHAEPGTRPVPR